MSFVCAESRTVEVSIQRGLFNNVCAPVVFVLSVRAISDEIGVVGSPQLMMVVTSDPS
jgi:hypothetical protein